MSFPDAASPWDRGGQTDEVSERADPLDLELDDVTGPEPPAVAELQDAARADRSGAEDVSRKEAGVARGVGDDCVPGVVHVAELAARALLTVHARDHRGAGAVELVGRDDERAEARREVLPPGGAEGHPPPGTPKVARLPVVHDGEAGDLAAGADDRRDLQL